MAWAFIDFKVDNSCIVPGVVESTFYIQKHTCRVNDAQSLLEKTNDNLGEWNVFVNARNK